MSHATSSANVRIEDSLKIICGQGCSIYTRRSCNFEKLMDIAYLYPKFLSNGTYLTYFD